MTEVYLGNPPQHVIDWIINHQQPAFHEETWYKYAGDTEWRTKMLGGTIALLNNAGTSTGQIDNPTNIVAIEIGTGTQANPVTSISNMAFYNCSQLTSITIPDLVTSIGYDAFYGCSGLTSVTIPDSVTSIGLGAFQNCSELTSVVIGNSVTSIEAATFFNCVGLKNVVIPNSVTNIGVYAFQNCEELMSVTIPDGVTSIEEGVFYNCRSLTSVTIPSSVTSIGAYAFYDCVRLSEMSMLGFTCEYVKENAYYWRIAVPAKQLVTIHCSDGWVILNDKSQSSDGKTNV